MLAESDGSAALRHVLEQARASDAGARTASTQEAIALARERTAGQPPSVVVVGPTVPHPLTSARRISSSGLDAYFVFAPAEADSEELRRQLFYAAPPGAEWAMEVADSPRLGEVIRQGVAAVARRKQLRATLDSINSRLSAAPPFDVARYRQLVVSDRYLASILDHAEDAIISLDPSRTVTSWNRAAERLLGVPSQEAVGTAVGSLLADLDEEIPKVTGRKVLRKELRCRVGDEVKSLDAIMSPIEGEGRDLIGFALIMRDITEHKRAEQALREADRRKDEFLAVLAHELRNPLAPIQNAVHILNNASLNEAQRELSRKIVERQVRHMARLLDDLLDISRISRGRLVLKKETVSLPSVIEAAVETARPMIDAKGHSLSVDLPAEPVRLRADPVRLTQIFGNLLTNAAKYTGDSGRIRIAASAEPDSVSVHVEDNGIGIARDWLVGIFEMFARTPSQHSENGIGVGLALTRGLVELHGGSIEAQSAGVGQGSRFVVRLPRDGEEAGGTPGEGAPVGRPGRSQCILVVDDNADAADSLAMTLELAGHRPVVVYDGREALAQIQRRAPDVVLLDIGMPGMDGYEVARRARAMPEGRHVRLVALTGWGQDEDRRRSELAGFDAHLTKPVDPPTLNALLEREDG